MSIEHILGLKGLFRIQIGNKYTGKVRLDTGWFPNVILNAGRNTMASNSTWMDFCQVGSDNTAPTQTDTSLQNYVAGTADIITSSDGQAASSPYYGWKRKTFRFAAGTVAANLTEVGVGWGLSGSTLISRALIIDPILGTPTTITPLADEVLDVTYELRYYPPVADIIGPQVTLNGVVYDTKTRAANVKSSAWSSMIGTAMVVGTAVNVWRAYDGVIGTVLAGPSGLVADADTANQVNQAYVSNSYQVKMNCPIGATGWNLGAGIRSVLFRTNAGEYQTEFTANIGGATIPKTTAFSMLLIWVLGWTEKV